MREARGQTPAHAAALSVLPLLFGGFGSLLTGLAPARLPHRAIAFFGFLGTAILLFAFTRIQAVLPAMLCMGMASFCSDLTMPISWNACVEIGGPYTATVAAAMNMLANLAGFIAPVARRPDPAENRRLLDAADLSDGWRRDDLRALLAISRPKQPRPPAKATPGESIGTGQRGGRVALKAFRESNPRLGQKYCYCNAKHPFGRRFSPEKRLQNQSPAHDTNCTFALNPRQAEPSLLCSRIVGRRGEVLLCSRALVFVLD